MITVETTGELLPWSDWKPHAPPRALPFRSPWARERERRLMFGSIRAALITEYQHHNGVSQFCVYTMAGPRPTPKFWSFGEALAYLQDRTNESTRAEYV